VADGERFAIRSYRVCFELERRIHRIDRWRIPVPYGIPLRGLAYAALVLAVVLVAVRLLLIGAVLGLLHPALRLVVIPVASASPDPAPGRRAAGPRRRTRLGSLAGGAPAAEPAAALCLTQQRRLGDDTLGTRPRMPSPSPMIAAGTSRAEPDAPRVGCTDEGRRRCNSTLHVRDSPHLAAV
jgi:hypothetical protein